MSIAAVPMHDARIRESEPGLIERRHRRSLDRAACPKSDGIRTRRPAVGHPFRSTPKEFAAQSSACGLLSQQVDVEATASARGSVLTRRCTQRLFLLRPDEETNNAFVYCLAIAAQRCEIDVLMTVAASNHHHTVIFDRQGRCSEFAECFHRLMARSQNALRGRWENFWAAEEPCITRLLDRGAVIAKLVYAATNPVKDRLVERVHHWPGVNGYVNFRSGRALRATRPRHFFRNPGPMPEAVTLPLIVPPELGPAAEVIEEVGIAVDAIERQVVAERRQTGASVTGRRAVLAQSWKATPQSVEPRRNLRPRFAGATEVRVDALARYGTFLEAYRFARKQWLAGAKATFPIGTYWLARFAAVSVAAGLAG